MVVKSFTRRQALIAPGRIPISLFVHRGQYFSSTGSGYSSDGERAMELTSASSKVQATRNRKRINVNQERDIRAESPYLDIVVATCAAESYDLKRILTSLSPVFPGTIKISEDVVFVQIPRDRTEDAQNTEAFVFSDGCFVLWGAQRDISVLYSSFKDKLKQFEQRSLAEHLIETESLPFEVRSARHFHATIESEVIVFESTGLSEEYKNKVIPAKLAFSNGLADSVKLAILENALNGHIERVKPIPETIASGGKLPVGRSEVLKLTGELLKFRADLNLHSELIDTPEIYWSRPELEELYIKVCKVLDIRQRVHVLNKKLDYANELASVLRSHLSELHSLKLEWGIIVLIAVEVAFETLHWITGS
jgi:uncharacterized Rmd1/YagE family protein